MNYKLINLTPHAIHVLMRDNKILTIESSGNARCEMITQVLDDDFNGVSLNSNTYGEVVGLPEPAENTLYIVSSIVAHAVKGKELIVLLLIKQSEMKRILLLVAKGLQ